MRYSPLIPCIGIGEGELRLGVIDAVGFVVSKDESSWISVSSLGFDLSTTGEVIRYLNDISLALSAIGGDRVEGTPLFKCPVVSPGKIVCIGLNYSDVLEVTGRARPDQPIVFSKYPSALTGPTDPIIVNRNITEQVDYEVELAVLLGSTVADVVESEAHKAIFGYCVANDVTARDIQAGDPRMTRSKSLDTFCPIGPWITTSDEVVDPQDLAIRSTVNGQIRQSSNTSQMLFSIAQLVAFVSRGTTFHPGDIILTGTPAGVGMALDPPSFLQAGDVIACEVEGLGAIENKVVMS